MSHDASRRQASRWPVERWKPRLAGIAFFGAVVLALQALVASGMVSTFLLPAPSAVAKSLPKLIVEEALLQRFAETAGTVLGAAALAILIGGLAGWVLYRWQNARLAYTGWVVGLNAAPSLLLYPFFLVMFGRGRPAIVALAIVSALPPIILSTCQGLSATRRVLFDVGRSFDLTAAQQFWLIQLPSAVPTLFSGIRLGLLYALTTVVSIEFLISFGGLGELIPDLADRYEIPAMYGAIIFIILISAAFQYAVTRLEKWLRPA